MFVLMCAMEAKVSLTDELENRRNSMCHNVQLSNVCRLKYAMIKLNTMCMSKKCVESVRKENSQRNF